MSQSEEKKQIRRVFRNRRSEMTEQDVAVGSAAICAVIEELPEYRKADCILCYSAFRNEVNLNNIMLIGWGSGKKVFLPRMEGDKMEFYLVESGDPLPLNLMGIPEPGENAVSFSRVVKPEETVLMIMPGVAFDRNCNRLGYGGGFYDRFLSRTDHTMYVIAAAYDLQISEEPLPHEVTDIRPEKIITETRVLLRDGEESK